MNDRDDASNLTEIKKSAGNNAAKGPSRRRFLGQVGAALTGGAVLGKAGLVAAQSRNTAFGDGIEAPRPRTDPRIRRCFAIRFRTADEEGRIPAAPQTTNGDEQRYRDKSGTYTKGLLQNGIGLVNLNAYQTFKRA